MNMSPSLYVILLPLFSMLAQPTMPRYPEIKKAKPPAKVAPTCAYVSGKEHIDYIVELRANEKYVWSIRDRNWLPMPPSLFGINSGLIIGPRFVRPGFTQEYILASVSHYKGTAKYLWRREPAPLSPSKLGEVFSNDEVEIELEIRVSPGARVVTKPEFPPKLGYWEPLIAPFKIEVSSDSVQRVEFYVNGYRDGKLVGFSWIPLVINHEGFSETKVEHEKKETEREMNEWDTVANQHADWHQSPLSERKIKLMKQEFVNRHSLGKRYRTEGLRSGEFLTDIEDPNRR